MIGDHIRALKGGRWIHGIDGGDKTVLHLGEGPGPKVLRTYRPLFVEGAVAVEVVTHREPVYPPSSVVARAWSPVRDPALGEMFGDSEAFASWCKSGRIPEASPAPVPRAAPGAGAPAGAPEARPKPAARAARAGAKPAAPRRKKASKRAAKAGKAPARKASPRPAKARKAPAKKRPAARKARR
jgi:hypothetical protein